MAKMSPLGIMNIMGDAADKKQKKSALPKEPDADDKNPAAPMKKPLQGKQIAAIKNKAQAGK